MLNLTIITFSILFVFIKHPISLGRILLAQTITTCLTIGLININYWYSYILFIIIIGGLLILFIYITRIASNEKFKISNILLIFTFFIVRTLTITFFFIDFFFLNYPNFSISINNINYSFIPLFSNKYINFPLNFIFIFTIFYLLICLIARVKICSIYKGPIRQSN